MKGFFRTMFAGFIGSLIALIIFVGVSILIVFGMLSTEEEPVVVKSNSILHIKFEDKIADRGAVTPEISNFSIKRELGIRNITQAIEKAKNDDKIKGIWLDLSSISGGIANVEEVRNSLANFKSSGKFIVSSADYYTHKTYYLASVANKVYLTPEGELQFIGLSSQIIMYKTLLEKLGIEPEIIRHGKFKSAVEPFMLDKISDANREQTLKYIGSIWNSVLTGVSKERKIPVDKLNMYADSLYISSANAAKKYNLIDDTKYRDEIIAELKQKTERKDKQELNLVSLNDYSKSEQEIDVDKETAKRKNKIAIIYAEGEIVSGEGSKDKIGSDKLAKLIRKVRKDSTIKGVVLRVNSPGGSALASEVIWRETVLLKKAKPFIVSMGNVAASGGYYITCFADTIVAEPNTITGSIGVFGLLFNAKNIMKTIGVNVSTVNTNTYSDLANPSRKMTPFERNIIKKGVEDVYETFVTHVAKGRKMSVEDVKKIAEGRVWSGADAKKIGLVDVFGGLRTAIDITAKKIGATNYKIYEYPEKDKFELMIESFLNDTKTSIFEEELGVAYKYYKILKDVRNIKGIQMRMPYFIIFE